MTFDPSDPRDESGKWSAESGAAAPKRIGKSDLKKVSATVTTWEARHRALSTERALVVDRAGKVLAEREGDKDSVNFTKNEKMAIAAGVKAGPVTLTHNHPNGAPLAGNDLVFAAEHHITEVRAVSAGSVSTMRLTTWPPSEEVRRAYDAATKAVRKDWNGWSGMFGSKGDFRTLMRDSRAWTDHRYATHELNNVANILTARRLGWTYSRESA